jgi:hypothetical protein
MANPTNATFSFTLDSCQITDTRSLHQDTDYVTFTLLVKSNTGAGTPQTLVKSLGDVNNGTHSISLIFSNIVVHPTDTITLNYLIVNSGHKSPGEVESALESAAVKLATAGGAALGGAILPVLGSALGAVGGHLATQLISILNANCDGAVAAEQNTFTYNDLIAKAAHGPFSQSTKHAGTNSPTGCGRNSFCVVNWHIMKIGSTANKVVSNVLELAPAEAAQRIQSVGLVAKFTGPNNSHSFVFSQSPKAGQTVDTGATVTMNLHSGPVR